MEIPAATAVKCIAETTIVTGVSGDYFLFGKLKEALCSVLTDVVLPEYTLTKSLQQRW